ncbi:DMT family transporter [Nicoliella spurrieriana]|uniref:DMT family transporter n=1 Tax=Nicoliella spurrieriana TaxID=2925830 RepID=A0A976RT82_9LACO|nr:DMT family transporter [Nicoliella spurrieriana]UQS87453.1 DMT family transporter [Nicoliella spurrieriana]
MQVKREGIGAILAIIGAVCWGIQGPISQFLFQDDSYSPEWLMGVKMTIAGVLILLFTTGVKHQPLLKVWQTPRDACLLLVYSLFGLAAVQYFYLVTVSASNAGTATILQSLGTIIIVILTAMIYHHLPSRNEGVAIGLALIGTWLLVTRGNLFHLAISGEALTLGLLLALAGALQTMLPVSLLKRHDVMIVVGWGMVIGGGLFSIIHPFWVDPPHFTVGGVIGVASIVILGTMVSFVCFTTSLKYVSPTVAGMLDTFEPLSATLGSVAFLNTSFNFAEICGGVLILSTVFVLALPTLKPNLK